MTLVANCETMDKNPTLKEPMEGIDMKGIDTLTRDEDERRLTPAQRRMRDDAADLPKHVRRSIDRYRQALGFVPLWGSSLDQRKTPARP